jgi:hypothetical protein
MNRFRHPAGRKKSRDDSGFAIVYVVGTGLIATLLVTMLVGLSVRSGQVSRRDQDYQASIAAAQAGVDDYMSRLNANSTYWQGTPDCSNLALKRDMTVAPAITNTCGWGSGTALGWQTVAGSNAATGQACSVVPTPIDCPLYHYDVDSSQTIFNGRISVTSTGRSRGIDRTVKVSVARHSFADFLYYSDIESTDPSNVAVFGVNNTNAMAQCNRHYWDSPTRTAICRDITFITGDTVNGPLHSNDAILVTGSPTFNGPVTTGYPACAPNAAGVAPPASSCYRNGGGANPTFSQGISYGGILQLPPTNSALLQQVMPGQSQGTPGCLYTGPTRLHFNSNGTVNVWSPYTLSVNAGCGTVPLNGAAVTVPNNNVIYVRDVPSTQATPSPGNCANGVIGGYPVSGDENTNLGEYDCRSGFALVDGAVSGRVTIGTDDNIVVVDDITYANGASGADSLGLIASNSVEVYHPVSCTNRNGSGVCTAGTNMSTSQTANPTISAAILSLNHSFGVQLYSLGASLGTLSVYGSISQEYRGAVGTGGGSTGYLKNYSYDTRLQFAPPPYYLNPVVASYHAGAFSEIPKAY